MNKNRKVELSTIIGKGSKIKGTLYVQGGIRIDGEIEGTIESDGFVTIGASGVAKADIKADECLISGKVIGNVTCKDAIELDRSAKMNGDIIAKILKIHTGAVFNGSSSMTSGSKPIRKPIITEDVEKKELAE
ncbi:MAG: polymer-forming cytoskeletal protein [Candidatus Tenebribacter burtonii]|jgi:cytoskeletal protein CcmA (bactofilin family)|nr:polymer-forming cytoskeletal protein [Candidatus Tenebribacter burtonii]